MRTKKVVVEESFFFFFCKIHTSMKFVSYKKNEVMLIIIFALSKNNINVTLMISSNS